MGVGGREEDSRQESENNNITSKIRYDGIPVSVSGDKTGIPKHMNPQGMFMDAGLCYLLVKNIGNCFFENPTPVQQHCIPIIMAGRDVMACAESGAGKTAAFLIPVVQMLMHSGSVYRRQQKTVSPEALIIVPTRELVMQVYEEARKLTRGSVVKPAVLYGGTNPNHQARDLGNGCNILVATVGRLLDFVSKGIVSFRRIKFLVLDEADKLLDASGNFSRIELMLPSAWRRQTLMFSQSFPDEIQRTARPYLTDYLFVTVSNVKTVPQAFYSLGKHCKRGKLEELLLDPGRNPREKTMIFAKRKNYVDFLATQGFPATAIHSGLKQVDREAALHLFSVGEKPICFATELAARGLNVPDIAHVINYDMPDDVKDYRIRIGNLNGEHARVSSFVDIENDCDILGPLVKMLAADKISVPDWLAEAEAGAEDGDGE